MFLFELGEEFLGLLRVDLAQDFLEHLLGAVLGFLALWRSHIEQERQSRDLPEQLQELRLPVLEGVAQHLDDVGAGLDRLAMRLLLRRKREPAEEPVTDNADEEK